MARGGVLIFALVLLASWFVLVGSAPVRVADELVIRQGADNPETVDVEEPEVGNTVEVIPEAGEDAPQVADTPNKKGGSKNAASEDGESGLTETAEEDPADVGPADVGDADVGNADKGMEDDLEADDLADSAEVSADDEQASGVEDDVSTITTDSEPKKNEEGSNGTQEDEGSPGDEELPGTDSSADEEEPTEDLGEEEPDEADESEQLDGEIDEDELDDSMDNDDDDNEDYAYEDEDEDEEGRQKDYEDDELFPDPEEHYSPPDPGEAKEEEPEEDEEIDPEVEQYYGELEKDDLDEVPLGADSIEDVQAQVDSLYPEDYFKLGPALVGAALVLLVLPGAVYYGVKRTSPTSHQYQPAMRIG